MPTFGRINVCIEVKHKHSNGKSFHFLVEKSFTGQHFQSQIKYQLGL